MTRPSSPYADCARLYERGDFETALPQVESATHDCPDDGRLWELQGLIQHARGAHVAALAALETAMTLIPLSPAGTCALAECYLMAGKRDLALDLYRYLLTRPQLAVGQLLRIAAGFCTAGAPGLSLKACREASQRDPDAAQPYYESGYYMMQCGYPVRLVETVMRKAVALDPECAGYRTGLAFMLWQAGREADACMVVARISVSRLREIGCRCCLNRLERMYELAGDAARAEVCRERTRQLGAA